MSKKTRETEVLTLRQETYCLKRALENLSQRQAYIEAFGRGNKTDKSIDELASRIERTVKVQSRLDELKKALAEKALWTKADMINDLKEIATECKDAPVTVKHMGLWEEERIDSKARSVAVNAIKTAGEMLGYKITDNEVNITIKLEDIMRKVESKEDY